MTDLATLTDGELEALYDAQYGVHSTVHQAYQAGRGELPDICASCAIEAEIEAEFVKRGVAEEPATTPPVGETEQSHG